MLVNCKEILEQAKKLKYAVPQFNINNLEWTKYILEECNRLNSPVILGVSEGAKKYMGGYKVVYNIVTSLIEELNITVPVVLHLDHGSSVESCSSALFAGFTSVMIDASNHSVDENIKITKEVVSIAQNYNATVEAEMGIVGGAEDGEAKELLYAKTEDVVKLVNETNIDFVAPALGSVHGIYKGEPKLDFDRMKEINQIVNIPLVLHGGTGIYDDLIKKSIECGICKININTDLQIVWTKAVREFLNIDKSVYDPRKVISSGEIEFKKRVEEKVRLFNSVNKAHN